MAVLHAGTTDYYADLDTSKLYQSIYECTAGYEGYNGMLHLILIVTYQNLHKMHQSLPHEKNCFHCYIACSHGHVLHLV